MTGYSMTPEQRSLLNRTSHSFKPLSRGGHLNIWQAIVQTVVPSIIFALTVLILTNSRRYSNPQLVSVLCGIEIFIGLLYPTIAFFLVVAGVVLTKLRTRIRWGPVIFWSWWPCWKFSACVIAAAAGVTAGNKIWYNQFLPYFQMDRLQSYDGINPESVEGVRLMDAGIVEFAAGVGVDRVRTGCMQNGATYCIAPVVATGLVQEGGAEPGKTYDFFVAGKDCCNCPGGMRIVDQGDRAFYRLAAEQWASLYGKTVEHPLFFTWSEDPVQGWKDLQTVGEREQVVVLACVFFAFLTYSFLANGLLGLLLYWGYAAPSEPAMPQNGMWWQGMTSRFLPQMHKYTTDTQAQQSGPVVL